MGSQHTLDVASGDAIVIVTRAATYRLDCHKMDKDWSLLLQYRTDSQPPAPYNEQSATHASNGSSPGRSPQERMLKKQPPSRPSPAPPRSPNDEEPPSAEAQTDAVRVLDGDQVAEAQEGIEFGVIRKLGDLPPDAIISEDGLAKLLGRHRVSIRRAVKRGELPPSVRQFGKSVWTIEALRDHMNKRLEAARKEAERSQQRISRLRP
jgi:hypothetical protein